MPASKNSRRQIILPFFLRDLPVRSRAAMLLREMLPRVAFSARVAVDAAEGDAEAILTVRVAMPPRQPVLRRLALTAPGLRVIGLLARCEARVHLPDQEE